jgi:UDP-2-acetamido-3-amino-2,3-dideoxy-glucuronate N-acetyltransferase
MTPKAKVGVIGAGYWGRNLLRNYAALDALGGFCELNPDTRAAQSALYPDVPAFSEVARLLDRQDLKAVVIATPAETHGDLVAAALAAGKHVLVEKPLCLDLTQAKRLGSDAKHRGLILMVGHLLLYHPAFRALRSSVEAGHLGQLRYIYSHRLSLGKIRREENALWSFAPHDISMILALVGGLPERVVTSGGNYLSPRVADTSLSHLSFREDVQAHIFVSWLHPYKDHRLVVVGTDGMIVFDDVAAASDKLRLYRHAVSWNGELPVINKAAAEPIPYEDVEPLRVECSHFLDCVAFGQQPLSDANEGLHVLSVLDACQRSLTSGQPTQPIMP